MHVVIVGCGRVGSALAADLVNNGHTVAVIDRRPEAFSRLGTDFAGQTLGCLIRKFGFVSGFRKNDLDLALLSSS